MATLYENGCEYDWWDAQYEVLEGTYNLNLLGFVRVVLLLCRMYGVVALDD